MNSVPDRAKISPLSVGDPDSLVYTLNGRVFRIISRHFYETYWQKDDGRLIESLAKDELIPQTTLIKHARDHEVVTLEHQLITPVIYPYEWSFSMLQDAGILVVHLLSRLEIEGLTLKDCHPYNILFDGSKPYYVDICSLTKAAGNRGVPGAFSEFVTHYIAPLCMWSQGNEYLARQSLAHLGLSPMPTSSWEQYIEGYSDLGLTRFLRQLISRSNQLGWRLVRRLYTIKRARKALDAIASKLPSAYRSHRIKPTHEYIVKLSPPLRKTIWGDYHSRSFEGKPSDRLQTIIDEAMRLSVSSAVDLACNQGLFSEMLAQNAHIKKVISIDRDSQAIDSFYRRIKHRDASKAEEEAFLQKITPVLSEFMPCGAVQPSPDLAERVRCDCVFALALTHHLLLSQGLRIEVVIKRVFDFTSKYALIEFMPLGLWDGNSAPPIPDWYNKHAFEDALTRFAHIRSVCQTEINRVLYVCEKKNLA